MMDTETLARLEELLAEEHHVIQFTDQGWTISHPLRERLDGSLFDCPMFWDADDPGVRGRFWLLDDGTLGARYDLDSDPDPDPDSDSDPNPNPEEVP